MQTIFGSHSAIPPFRLLRPTRPEDAAAARAEAGPDTWFMAGGVDLVPAMRAGRKAATLISLSEIASMRVIERRGARLRIGAGCSYGAIAADRNVADALPDLAGALGGVANVRVRHAASIGGNIMARQANYDALTALIALDATLIFVRPSGERLSISAGAEMPDALLEAVEIPLSTRSQFAFERGFKPIVSVAVALEFADGAITGRAAIGCAHALPIGLALDFGAAASLTAERAAAVAAAAIAAMPTPKNDLAASGAYRRTLAGVLVRREVVGMAQG